jgi:hypothetical protein
MEWKISQLKLQEKETYGKHRIKSVHQITSFVRYARVLRLSSAMILGSNTDSSAMFWKEGWLTERLLEDEIGHRRRLITPKKKKKVALIDEFQKRSQKMI